MRNILISGLFLGLILLFAACAPQKEPPAVEKGRLITIQDIPTLTSIPVNPKDEPVAAGFNIRGWT
jgi:hypothetical protein